MVSLLDIGELSETVPVRGHDMKVTGVSAKGMLVILNRFPAVRKLVASRGQDVSVDELVKLAPDAIACVIAAGCGTPGDEALEGAAEKLTAGEQLELLSAIWKLTFPTGLGPFVEKLTELVGGNVGAASGWVAGTKLPEGSNSSLHPDMQ